MRVCHCGNPSLYPDKASGQNRWCRECKNKVNNAWSKKSTSREKRRDRDLRRTYGFGLDEFNRRSTTQGHVCAICKRPNVKRELAVDHNHTTNKNRGLLCDACNLAIGMLQENPAVLYRAIEYLNQWKLIHAQEQDASQAEQSTVHHS